MTRYVWLGLVILNAAFLIYIAPDLPPQVLGKIDFEGNVHGTTPKALWLGVTVFLFLAFNTLLPALRRLKPDGRFFQHLNIPYKKFWLSTPERRARAKEKMNRVLELTACYVNAILFFQAYMTAWYHFPSRFPCPKPLLGMLVVFVLGAALAVHTWFIFRTDER